MKRNTLYESIHLVFAAAADGGRVAIEPTMTLRPLNAEATEVELLIYGYIGDSWWGESVTAKSVVDQLLAMPKAVATVYVRINSYGGSVADGLAIHNALRRHAARKVVTVDGVAISSASLIVMAGDEVRMPEASMLMIHAPWGVAQGNAQDMRTMAQILDAFADAMSGSYARKSGKPKSEMLALLTDGQDHYYTAAQAKDAGFADEIVDELAPATTDDAEARAFAAPLLERFLSRTSAANAQSAIAAALRGFRTPPTRGTTSPATPALDGEDDMRFKLRAQLRAPEGQAGAGGSPTPATTTAQTPEQVLASVRNRNDQIVALLKPFIDRPGIRAMQDEALLDPIMTLDTVKDRALAFVGASAQPANPAGGGRVEGGVDSRDRFIEGVSNAIVARAGIIKPEAGNEFNGIKLQTLVRMCLTRAGRAGAERMEGPELARQIFALHGTSDFPLVLANTANKALRAAYETQPQTWRQWCAIGDVPDFKSNSRIQVGSFNSLATIPEGQEYTSGTMTEEAESITAATKGKKIALTRQMIINDDLGAFMRLAKALGFAAGRTVNEDVYAFLAANAATSDTGLLFNTTAVTTTGGHANLAGSNAAITVASIAIGEAQMGAQKDPGLKTTLNLFPKFLLAPRGKRQLAFEVLNSTSDPASSNAGKKNFAASLGLDLVTDSELDRASTTAWYLVADQNQCALVEVVFVGGLQTPFVEENVNWDTDALELKTRIDYGVGPGDWRGGFKNIGA